MSIQQKKRPQAPEGGYEMKIAITIYSVLVAIFLLLLTLRAELVQESKPPTLGEPLVTANGGKTDARKSQIGRVR
jgi:hypothetical protein